MAACLIGSSPPLYLLKGDQHKNQPTSSFQRRHRLPDNRSLSLPVVSDLHGVAGGVGRGQQVGRLNRTIGVCT